MWHFGCVWVEDRGPGKWDFTPYAEIDALTELPTETIGFTLFRLLPNPQVLDTGKLRLLSVCSPLLTQNHNDTWFLKLFREKNSFSQLGSLEKMDENTNGSKVLLQKKAPKFC